VAAARAMPHTALSSLAFWAEPGSAIPAMLFREDAGRRDVGHRRLQLVFPTLTTSPPPRIIASKPDARDLRRDRPSYLARPWCPACRPLEEVGFGGPGMRHVTNEAPVTIANGLRNSSRIAS
jgi:hypothetical protein